jgi:TolB-like protein/DNA-binding winged helix-turn-helix (wHTH) protein
VRFGVYELDARAGELRKGGVKVRLQEQPLQILTLLVDRPGEIVTREAICKKLWPNGTFVDFDHSLNAAVMRLREALDDSADDPRFIETVPRRGYRFLGPVLSHASPRRNRWGWVVAPAAFLALVALAFALDLAGLRSRLLPPASSTTPQIKSIAVLPLKNLTNDPSQDYFVEGMHDALIGELSRISAFTTISRTSTLRYKQTDKSIPEIARELNNVDAIVEGAVLREGGRVRISVQLIHASTDRHLWAQTFDRDVGSIFFLYSDVARAIAREVHASLTPAEEARLAAARPVDPDLYAAYLKGYQALWVLAKPEDIERAVGFFNAALERDSTYAPAWVGLANAHFERADKVATSTTQREEWQKAKEAARKALDLDDNLPDAHAILAHILSYDWDWLGAESSVKRAMQLDPNSFEAHLAHFYYLMRRGKFEESLRECLHFQELHPLSPINWNLSGMAHYRLQNYEQALESWKKSGELAPGYYKTTLWPALAYLGKGDKQKAVAAARNAEKLLWGNTWGLAITGHVFGRAGLKEDALRLLGVARERLKSRPDEGFAAVAIIHAGLGQKDEAFGWLEKALQRHDPRLAGLPWLPWYDPLRDDPRFQDLMRRMNFPE